MEAAMIKCTHRTFSGEYATISRTFPTGTTWITCLRCGKLWKNGQFTAEEQLEVSVIQLVSKQPETQIAALETERRIKDGDND